MKRVIAFVALTVSAVGMATAPASAAGLEKFSISRNAELGGYGGAHVFGKIKCKLGTARNIAVLVSQPGFANGDGTALDCTGETQTWDVWVEGYYQPGRAQACATTEEQVSAAASPRTCKRIVLTPAP